MAKQAPNISNGKRLLAWREAQKLSQVQAGERVGVSQPTWRRWEHGTVPALEEAILVEALTGGAVAVRGWAG